MLFYVQMDENQNYPDNLVHLPTGYNPHHPEEDSSERAEFEEQTKGWSAERREKFLTRLVVPALLTAGVVLLLKYGGDSEKVDIVQAAEEYANGEVPIVKIAQELGIEEATIYDGTIILKPGCNLRSSPEGWVKYKADNLAGQSSTDPNNPTTATNPLVVKDLNKPRDNGYWFSVTLEDGKTVWVNEQNVVEFDIENIKRVDIQLPEEQ
jgi:hypothetical protein